MLERIKGALAALTRSLVEFARKHVWILVAHLIAGGATIWAVFTGRFLPLLDWPQHLAVVSAMSHYGDPAYGLDAFWAPDVQIETYMTFYHGGAALGWFVGPDAALRLLLLFGMVGLPIAVSYALNTFGRSAWLGLLVYPAVFCWPFYMGFGAYVMCLPFIFFTVGLVQEISQECTRRRLVTLGIVGTLAFFTHALAYLVLMGTATVLLFAFNWKQWRRMGLTIVALVPSGLFFLLWFFANFASSHEDRVGSGQAAVHGVSTEGGLFGAVYEPVQVKIDRLAYYFNEAFPNELDRELVDYWHWVLLALFVVGLGLGIARWRGILEKRPPSSMWRPVLVGLLMTSWYWLMPMEVAGIWAISPRMVVLGACGLCFFVGPLLAKEWQNALLSIPALGLVLYTANLNHEAFAAFQEETEGLEEVLEAIPMGKRTYGLTYAPGSGAMSQAVHLHSGAYYMVERGGLTGFTFMSSTTMPLRHRNISQAPYPGRRGEWELRRWKYDLYGPFYDYLFVRGPVGSVPRMIGAPDGALRLVAHEGVWGAYENLNASPGVAAVTFREVLHRAHAFQTRNGERVACEDWEAGRLQCPHAEWSWVGPSEQTMGRTLVPCIWAHPVAGTITSVRFEDLPEGTIMRGFYGMADPSYQSDNRAPVHLDVDDADGTIARYETGARPGYQTFELDLRDHDASAIEFSITVENDAVRHFCFGATIFDE